MGGFATIQHPRFGDMNVGWGGGGVGKVDMQVDIAIQARRRIIR